jgi:hypothetical protein
MKLAVFWVVALYSLVVYHISVFQEFLLPPSSEWWLMMEAAKFLWNDGKLLPHSVLQQPKRQPFSYSLPWQPKISLRHYTVKCASTFSCTPSPLSLPVHIHVCGIFTVSQLTEHCTMTSSDKWDLKLHILFKQLNLNQTFLNTTTSNNRRNVP